MLLCMKWYDACLDGVHRMHWDGSSFMWHQPCQCYKYTTLVDIQKSIIKTIHSCRVTCERSESAREQRKALHKSDHQVNIVILITRSTCIQLAGTKGVWIYMQQPNPVIYRHLEQWKGTKDWLTVMNDWEAPHVRKHFETYYKDSLDLHHY